MAFAERVDTFLESKVADAGAFAPVERELQTSSKVSDRVQSRLTSRTGTQEIRQQLLKGVPVVGASYKTVQSDRSSVLVGTPTADLEARDPGPRRPRSRQAVVAAAREQLGLDSPAESVEPVIFPIDGTGICAYDVRPSDAQSTDCARPRSASAWVRRAVQARPRPDSPGRQCVPGGAVR